MDILKLDELYKLYRFQILPVSNIDIRVYSFTSKYFSNADIIVLNNKVKEQEITKIHDEVESLGFSVKIRNYKTLNEAEESLFDGFFDIEKSNKLLKKSYDDYKTKIEKVIFGDYQYINSEYYDVEKEVSKNDDIVQTILKDLNKNGPVLIILEAAAGFGKTSTSYEIIKDFANNEHTKKVPLFTELSRNRQASIFKYVLYDEINRRFTGLSLELINKHIIEGRIPVIIDGFDELLKPKSHERSEDKFEDAEPMLETIKELLRGDAKILLTTRRTAIFSDDEFFKWLDDNEANFTFCRYSISDPTISDWIPATREKELQKAGLNLKSISNPVLLAYLKSMDDEQFAMCLHDIDIIIEDYIVKLMERENERQELNMSVDEQKAILKIISKHFTDSDVTSESKEVLEKKILEQEQKLMFEVLDRYSTGNRPTIDQLLNKLMIHAFLDRKGDSNHQLGFVNDFILGSFVGVNLLEEKETWIGMERFIDFILTAYIPRSTSTKRKVYEILNNNLLNYLNISKRVFIDNYLYGEINRELNDAFLQNIEFRNHFNQKMKIENSIFSECEFYDINLGVELTEVTNTHFINCNFFNCMFAKEILIKNQISLTNCNFSPESEIENSYENEKREIEQPNLVNIDVYERTVLEKFWPSGKERFIPHKRLVTLRSGVTPTEIKNIDEAIESLLKSGYIIQRKGQHSLDLNVRHINEIKKILGR